MQFGPGRVSGLLLCDMFKTNQESISCGFLRKAPSRVIFYRLNLLLAQGYDYNPGNVCIYIMLTVYFRTNSSRLEVNYITINFGGLL